MSNVFWTETEVQILRDRYPQIGLKATAKLLNRPIRGVAGKASNLGIKQDRKSAFFADWQRRAARSKVGKKRPDQSLVMKSLWARGALTPPTEERKKKTGASISRHWKEYGHPRGMLGKKHSLEFKLAMAEHSRRMWRDPNSKVNSAAFRQMAAQRMSRQMIARLKAGVHIYSNCRRGRRADLDNMFFRSAWEANYARYLKWMKTRSEILDWKYEPDTFWFEKIRRGVRSYTPDFKIWEDAPTAPYYKEIKGWMDKKSVTKLKRMQKYYPEIRVDLVNEREYRQIETSLARIIPGWEFTG